eukprot:943049-Pleurochrysis_carterae.AAC.1
MSAVSFEDDVLPPFSRCPAVLLPTFCSLDEALQDLLRRRLHRRGSPLAPLRLPFLASLALSLHTRAAQLLWSFAPGTLCAWPLRLRSGCLAVTTLSPRTLAACPSVFVCHTHLHTPTHARARVCPLPPWPPQLLPARPNLSVAAPCQLDLSQEDWKLLYRMEPPSLLLASKPSKPSLADVSPISWPILLAAAAVRLIAHWEPAVRVRDDCTDANTEHSAQQQAAHSDSLTAAQPDSQQGQTQGGGQAGEHGGANGKMAAGTQGQGLGGGSEQAGGCGDRCADSCGGGASSSIVCGASSAIPFDLKALEAAVQVLLRAPASEGLSHFNQLAPSQKLALLHLLVEAAADTPMAGQAAERRCTRRAEWVARTEAEDREAKRTARREREEVRARVRARLREAAGEEGPDVSEAMVSAEVVKSEEDAKAFGGDEVKVISREQLQKLESELAVSLEVQ